MKINKLRGIDRLRVPLSSPQVCVFDCVLASIAKGLLLYLQLNTQSDISSPSRQIFAKFPVHCCQHLQSMCEGGDILADLTARDLFRCLAVFDAFDDQLLQFRVTRQLAVFWRSACAFIDPTTPKYPTTFGMLVPLTWFRPSS